MTMTPTSSISEAPEKLPRKHGFHGQRWLRHRAFILYRKFFSVVLIANLAIAGLLLYRTIHQGKNILPDVATATAANLCTAVLMRSEPVVNLLFTVFCSIPVCILLTLSVCECTTDNRSDLFPTVHTPSVRPCLSHRRHTQRMRARSYHLVCDISHPQQHRTCHNSVRARCNSCSNNPLLHGPRHLPSHRRNIASRIPREVPQCMGNDASLWWMDVSCSSLDADVPGHKGRQSSYAYHKSLPSLTFNMATHRRHSSYHLPLAVPTQSRRALSSSLASRCATLVRLHDSRRRHSRASCRATFG
jgi:hypothetical protein